MATAPELLSVGAFGKIPSQGDFLRVQCVSPALTAFDAWLEDGIDALRAAQIALPSGPLSFLFRAADAREVLLGVLAPSRDSVGRQFPLVVFAALGGASVSSLYPILPTACGRFLAAAAQLASAPPGSAAEVAARVQKLPVPSPKEFSIADEMREHALRDARAEDFAARLFAAPPDGRLYYALRTFMAGCEPLRGKESDRAGPTLDCPVVLDLDRLAWLELAHRSLGWREAPPSILWDQEQPSRVLISLGPAPPALLLFHARPDRAATAFWPLATERPDAIESARRALKPGQREAIEQGLALDALFHSLTT